MAKLTKRTVDAARPQGRDRFIWDEEMEGFGLRIFASGLKSYVIQYRAAGRTRRLVLGSHGELTAAQARKLAQKRLGEVREGGDPSAERKKERTVPTVAAVAARYLEQHARPKKKKSSVRGDEDLLRLYIFPALGRKRVDAVTRRDLADLHHSLRGKPYQANRVLALASLLFNLAERWGLRKEGTNPTRHVDRYREAKRERFLSSAELARLGEVLSETERDGSEPFAAVLAVRLLALTGCRREEILSLRWDQVDFERGYLHLDDSKTGRRSVPLGAPARQLLAEAPRVEGNPYVCPGGREGAHLVGLTKVWYRLRDRAGLADVRLHDLRHSFASVGAGGGLGLPIIGALLGHSQPATTARYAHLADDPLRQAADSVAGEIAAAMGGGESREVIPFRAHQ